MPFPEDNFKKYFPVGYNREFNIEGLDIFKKNLEKHLFSDVVVRNCSSSATQVKLVLEVNCNFGLIEMLHYFNSGAWGNFRGGKYSFEGQLQHLKDRNDLKIEVEEFYIFLKDTAIIITRIYDKSIPEQLENILGTIGDQYVHFTKGMTEIPYEIYIPVFEEHVMQNDTALTSMPSNKNSKKDYFGFWGLYFHSNDEGIIYDLENLSHLPGNLHMLNR
jgi:hypothetical protein